MTDEQLAALQLSDEVHRGDGQVVGQPCAIYRVAGTPRPALILRGDDGHLVVLGAVEGDPRDQFHLPVDCPLS